MLMLTVNRNERERDVKWKHSTEFTCFPTYKENRRVTDHYKINNYYLVNVPQALYRFEYSLYEAKLW